MKTTFTTCLLRRMTDLLVGGVLATGLTAGFICHAQTTTVNAYYTIQPNADKTAFVHTLSWVALDTQFGGSTYDDPLTTGVNEGNADKINRNTSFGNGTAELHSKDDPLGQTALSISPGGTPVEVRYRPGTGPVTNSYAGGYVYLGTDLADGSTAPQISTPKWDDVGSITTEPNGAYAVGFDGVTGFRADNPDGTGATTTDIGLYIDTDDVTGGTVDDVGPMLVGFADGNPQEAPISGYVQMIIPVASGSTTDTYFLDPNGFWPESGWKAAYVAGVHTDNPSIEVTVTTDPNYTPKLAVQGDLDADLDVDSTDLGVVTGNFSGAAASGVFFGKYYRHGDMDDDYDVDNADIGLVIGADTTATPGSGTGADLIYDPSNGNVQLVATDAAGAIITSFQLENGAGTFIPGSYTSLSGGGFGSTYEDATVNALGDSDPTLAGFNGTVDLGNVFPTGMDLAGLQAYLTTAVYTGEAGSGQQSFDLSVSAVSSAYNTWAETDGNAPGQGSDEDYDGDGVENGVEFVLGGDKDTNDSDKLPTVATPGGDITFTFVRDPSSIDASTDVSIEVSTDLNDWSTSYAVPDGATANNPGVTVLKDSPTDFDTVTLTLPRAPDATKFARLKVVITP